MFAFLGSILLLHSYYYYPFLSDDALISLRYAERFIEGKGLTWNDGEYVEGYSNLLWILLISSISYIGVDLLDTVRIAGLLLILAIPVVTILFYYDKDRHQLSSLFISMAFYVLAAPLAVWSIGGLEQPLLAFLLVISIITFDCFIEHRKNAYIILTSICLGFMVLTRPDAPLFVIAFVLALVLSNHSSAKLRIRGAVLITTITFSFFAAQMIFRLFYYGDILPNTAYVKLTPSGNHLINGLVYVFSALAFMFPYLPLIAFIIWKNIKGKSISPLILLLVISLLIYLTYLVSIGGDVFPAYRHFIVVIVVFFVVLVKYSDIVNDFIILLTNYINLKNPTFIIVAIILSFALLQIGNHASRRAKHERWEWIGKELAETLKEAFSNKQPLLAVTAAGCIPYWSKLPALDMLGLNDKHIAKNRPRDIGSGMLGHELGDADYILDRKPDLIIFNVGEFPTFRPGRDLVKKSEFHALYKPFKIFLPGKQYYSKVFIRYGSPKVGIKAIDNELIIPGYLFADTLNVHTRLIESKLLLCLTHSQRATFELDWIHYDYEFSYVVQNHEKIFVQSDRIGKMLRITLINLSNDVNYVEYVKFTKRIK